MVSDPRILSERATPRIERLYAVVLVDGAGIEGIMRRDTPSGTQPWITDDAVLAKALPMLAAIDAGMTAEDAEQLRVVEFARV